MERTADLRAYGYMSAGQYAGKHGVSKTWVASLCKQKRIVGSYKSFGTWIIPIDAPLPEKGRRGPKAWIDPVEHAKQLAEWESRKAQALTKERHDASEDGLTDRQKVMLGWIKDGYGMAEGGLRFNRDGSEDGPVQGWTEFDFIFWRMRRGRVVEI